jgi:predicted GNAT family acetyltransferase
VDATVRDNVEQRRFEVHVGDQLAGFAAYRVRDGVTVITHTEVDPEFRGQGVAAQLARQTLDLLRERGARLLPQCPYFAAYVAEHPEYADLVDA